MNFFGVKIEILSIFQNFELAPQDRIFSAPNPIFRKFQVYKRGG